MMNNCQDYSILIYKNPTLQCNCCIHNNHLKTNVVGLRLCISADKDLELKRKEIITQVYVITEY